MSDRHADGSADDMDGEDVTTQPVHASSGAAAAAQNAHAAATAAAAAAATAAAAAPKQQQKITRSTAGQRSGNAAAAAASSSSSSALPSDLHELDRESVTAMAESIPEAQRTLAQQFLALPSADLAPSILASLDAAARASFVAGMSRAELFHVCAKLRVASMQRSTKDVDMRKKITKIIARWVQEDADARAEEEGEDAADARTPVAAPTRNAPAAATSSLAAPASRRAAPARVASRSAPVTIDTDADDGMVEDIDDNEEDDDEEYASPPRSARQGRRAPSTPSRSHSRSPARIRAASARLTRQLRSDLPLVSLSRMEPQPATARPLRVPPHARARAAPSRAPAGLLHQQLASSSRSASRLPLSSSEEEDDMGPASDADIDRMLRMHGHGSSSRSARSSDASQLDESFLGAWFTNVMREGSTVLECYNRTAQAWAPRNKHEAISLARIIDAINSGDTLRALEMSVRRLTAVHLAEQTGSWSHSNIVEGRTEQQAFLPAGVFAQLTKQASRLQTLMAKSASGYHATPSSSSRTDDKKGAGGGAQQAHGAPAYTRTGAGGGANVGARPTGSGS
jgi:hypothetical protein